MINKTFQQKVKMYTRAKKRLTIKTTRRGGVPIKVLDRKLKNQI